MPVVPNTLERVVWLRLNRAPGPFLDLFGAAGFRAVALAVEMGLYEALADGAMTPADLASTLDADEQALSVLLSFLAALGYVERSGEAYHRTGMTRSWLAPADRTDVGPWLTFWNELAFPYWDEHLRTALQEGRPPQSIYEWFDAEPHRWETAQADFAADARLTAPEVVDRVSIPKAAQHIVDVGGGHGVYSVALCRAYPGLEATVFDAPEASAVANETIATADMHDRIDVAPGDYFEDALPAGDVALVFNVVHAHEPAKNIALFERIRAALGPGGRVIVMDQFDADSWMARLLPTVKTALAFVSLTYLVTLGGQTYPADEVGEWLRSAGFDDVRRRYLRRAPGVSLLIADVRE